MKPGVTGREWLWATGVTLLVMALVSLPYVYGFASSTPARQFGGFVIGLEDGNSYLAKMQIGAAGGWLFHLAYTPEPHPGAFFFVFYLLLGKLANLLGLSPLLALHLSRAVTIPFALLSFYYFVAAFTDRVDVRRLALLLFGLTAGLGWLWVLLGLPATLGAMPVDLWVPDASFFLAAFTFPHLPLAQGLLLWLALASLDFLDTGAFRAWALAAGAGLLVSLIHPYSLPVLDTVLGCYLLWQAYQRRKSLGAGLGRLALIAAPALPYLIYVLAVFEANFAFRAWRDQSLTLSPQPIHYLLGFGLILSLAGLGAWPARRLALKHRAFFIIWALIIPPLLYLPIPLQRRFLDGYQAPLALLGAIGLVWLGERLHTRMRRVLVTVAIFAPLLLTNLLLVSGGLAIVKARAAPIFLTGAQRAAFDWLAGHGPGQVVLAAYETGNYLPAYAPVRAFVGHGPETVRSDEKRQLAAQFFAVETSDDWRRGLLVEYNIRYVYFGPHERALGGFNPDEAPYLRRVYQVGDVVLYAVVL